MQSGNTGKTITKIRISEKKVAIYFKNEKIDISKEAYVNAYLFVGKTLSIKDINQLKKMTNIDKGLKYALSLLKKSVYSEYKIREKLYNKELDKKDVDDIIKILKNNDLINDDAFMEDALIEMSEKNYGKHKIIAKLKERGIFEDRIKKIKFTDSKELTKAKAALVNLERKYQNFNFENKKRHIYESLIRSGFDSHIALSVIKLVKENPIKVERQHLKSDYQKLSLKAKQKYPKDSYRRKEYVFSKLMQLGYSYQDISKIMEE